MLTRDYNTFEDNKSIFRRLTNFLFMRLIV